jgi:hypothetical protein
VAHQSNIVAVYQLSSQTATDLADILEVGRGPKLRFFKFVEAVKNRRSHIADG